MADSSSKYQYSEETTCLQLAIDGQRLCRNGDVKTGIHFFESALKQGTNDLTVLTVVYSQLGNAYFSLREYGKSLHYHRLDLALSRRLGDLNGEAKACGNLGNTLKMLGKFDEAAACCEMHLKITRKQNDKPGVARALYNLANVYHQKAKSSGAIGRQDLGQFPTYIQEALEKAAQYYEENLKVCKEIGDRATQGLACGNLANTHYLLGNFQKAIELHTQRLEIAKEFGHRAAERRAYSNRGNAYIFLANFEAAIEDYRSALQLAKELNDETLEAQVCYSLGNTYYIMRRYTDAAVCLEHHLSIAKQLGDLVGEARAYWSLTNIHSDNGEYTRAKVYAGLHLDIANQMCDGLEVNTANENLSKLDILIKQQKNQQEISQKKKLQQSQQSSSTSTNHSQKRANVVPSSSASSNSSISGSRGNKKDQALNRNIGGSLKSSGSKSKTNSGKNTSQTGNKKNFQTNAGSSLTISASDRVHRSSSHSDHLHDNNNNNDDSEDELLRSNNCYSNNSAAEDFFQLLSKFQSRRMDEQRCSIRDEDEDRVDGDGEDAIVPGNVSSNSALDNRYFDGEHSEEAVQFLELVAGVQGSRMDDQRAVMPSLEDAQSQGDTFPGLRASQAVLDRLNHHHQHDNIGDHDDGDESQAGGPSDALLEMIARCQAARINDQRSSLPEPPLPNNETVVNEELPGSSANHPAPSAAVTHTPNNNQSTLPIRIPAPTVPDEDLMALIARLSSYRLDEQRCSPPFPLPALSLANTQTNHITGNGDGNFNGERRDIDESDGLPEHPPHNNSTVDASNNNTGAGIVSSTSRNNNTTSSTSAVESGNSRGGSRRRR